MASNISLKHQSTEERINSISTKMWQLLTAIWKGELTYLIGDHIIKYGKSTLEGLHTRGFVIIDKDGEVPSVTVTPEHEEALKKFIGYGNEQAGCIRVSKFPYKKVADQSVSELMDNLSDPMIKALNFIWSRAYCNQLPNSLILVVRKPAFKALIDRNFIILKEKGLFVNSELDTELRKRFLTIHPNDMSKTPPENIPSVSRLPAPRVKVDEEPEVAMHVPHDFDLPKRSYYGTGLRADTVINMDKFADCDRSVTDKIIIQIVVTTLQQMINVDDLDLTVIISTGGYIHLGICNRHLLNRCISRFENCNMTYWFKETLRSPGNDLQKQLDATTTY